MVRTTTYVMVKLKDKDATTFLVNQQRFKNYIGKDVD